MVHDLTVFHKDTVVSSIMQKSVMHFCITLFKLVLMTMSQEGTYFTLMLQPMATVLVTAGALRQEGINGVSDVVFSGFGGVR